MNAYQVSYRAVSLTARNRTENETMSQNYAFQSFEG